MSTSDKGLKKLVLEEQMGFLCEELGDPKRYFPYLRSKGALDSSDCQSIRAQTTFKEQVEEMVSLLKGRQSRKGEHAFDILVEALKQQRVQAHIARSLQKALVKAKDDSTTMSNGVNGRVSAPPSTQVPQEESRTVSSIPPVLTVHETDESKPYEVHPLHGALPPRPVDHSMPASSPVYEDQTSRPVHPTYGLLPPRAEQQEFTDSSMGESCFTGSDSEQGGQSQPNSMLTTSSYADTTTTSSSQFISHDSTSSSISDTNSMNNGELARLTAQVDKLTLKLEEAEAELKRKGTELRQKDAIISSLQHQLGSRAGNGHAFHPHQLKLIGSDSQVHTLASPSNTFSPLRGQSYHSVGSISPQSLDRELGGQPQAMGEGHLGSLNNRGLVSRSKSSSPGASESFV